jgi:anti-sigma-K factor RskA
MSYPCKCGCGGEVNKANTYGSPEHEAAHKVRMTQERRAMMLANVTANADSQSTAWCRENFFRSCEAHDDPVLTAVVNEVRLTYHQPRKFEGAFTLIGGW